VKLPLDWLNDLVTVPADVDAVARTLGLRGFEVASVETSPHAVIDFEITANRPDCLSVIGLAREASAAYGQPLREPDAVMPDSGALDAPVEVTIEDAERCPRYCAQVFEVRGSGQTPGWMRDRLEAAGVRSISAIVDVTNYVMLELGQPTHAFDLATLAGRALRIRVARDGETVRTLDGVERRLEPGMLVIADAQRAQAVAGVMGGAASEIGAATSRLVLESAYFQPASVRRTSKRLALKTEASSRFERGADIDAAPAAIARAAVLFAQLGVARPLGPMIDRYPSPRQPLTIALRASRIAHVLGIAVDDAAVPRILTPLGFAVEPQTPNLGRRPSDLGPRTSDVGPRTSALGLQSWSVTVPTFRVDVQREIDLIEEIARHDGYVGLPATFPVLAEPQAPPDPRTLTDRGLRHVLTACGLSEAMTFAFVERSAALPFAAGLEPAPLANPLSEKYAVLRPSLLPGLVDAAAHNRRRERRDIRLFETGTRFTAAGEGRAVAGVWGGSATTTHWSDKGRPVDFYDVKGVVDALAQSLGVELEYVTASRPHFVDGRAALVRLKGDAAAGAETSRKAQASGQNHERNGAELGEVGQLAPALLDARGLPPGEPLFAFELDVDALAAARPGGDLRANSLPRFPSIVRDLSILVDASLPAATVRGTIRSAGPATLVELVEFDRYRGKGVPDGQVSLSVRLTFRSAERTLTDAEVDAAMDAILAALAKDHGAVRR
jgi:phenylalanyl-tRNA synthetase beta chain